ncbi:MAG: hypothetical protein K2Z81_23565 [Cyanobacteria bacterium]|nr:hypothetical protein [Cyanobacteriota bacterium]
MNEFADLQITPVYRKRDTSFRRFLAMSAVYLIVLAMTAGQDVLTGAAMAFTDLQYEYSTGLYGEPPASTHEEWLKRQEHERQQSLIGASRCDTSIGWDPALKDDKIKENSSLFTGITIFMILSMAFLVTLLIDL